MATLTLDALKARVDEQVGTSRWFLVDQARIDAFAEATEDRQFIHVDPDAAGQTLFGGTIAHGFLSLSMLSAMAYDSLPAVENMQMMVNYGLDRVRFLAPVRAGSRVRGLFELAGVEPRGPGHLMRYHVTVEIEGHDKPALTADWLGLVITS